MLLVSGHAVLKEKMARWLDNITEDCEELNLTIHQASRLANDRVKWRNTVRNRGVIRLSVN